MFRETVLGSEHITIKTESPKTDAFVQNAIREMKALLEPENIPESLSLHIVCDETGYAYECVRGEAVPDISEAIGGMSGCKKIEIYIDMLAERGNIFEQRERMTKDIKTMGLQENVRVVSLMESGTLSSLTVCGMEGGVWRNGDVPFVTGDSDVLAQTGWINSTQHAVFGFAQEKIDAAYDIMDELNEKLDIDIEMDEAKGTLEVLSVALANRDEVFFYADRLEALCEIAENTTLTGAMSPDTDGIYGLIRFVRDAGRVILQTASVR